MRLQTCVSVIVEIIVAEPEEGPTISHGLSVAMYLQVEETDEHAATTGQSSNYMAYTRYTCFKARGGGGGGGILLGQSHRVAVFELCAALQLSNCGGC
jgi:hypothetical protein